MITANYLRLKLTSDSTSYTTVAKLALKKQGVVVLDDTHKTGVVFSVNKPTFSGESFGGSASTQTSHGNGLAAQSQTVNLVINFPTALAFDELDFSGSNSSIHASKVTDLIIETSNDGVNYTQLDSLTGLTFVDEVAKSFLLSESTPVAPVAPVAPTQTIDAMINDAFVSAKTYIDAKDAGLKAYTDAALAQLMNTTDLTAKLSLLEQINTILDGDAATAGFQAWQAALTRLNAIETKAISDVSTLETKITNAHDSLNALVNTTSNDFTIKINANKAAADSADAAIAARVLTLETTTHTAVTASVSTLDTKVTTSVATVQTGINANFAAMKAKAAILFAV